MAKADNTNEWDEGWETVREETPDRIVFDTFGDVFVGAYVGPMTVTPEGTDRDGNPLEPFVLHVFRGVGFGDFETGKLYAVNSSYAIDQGLNATHEGDLVRLTYVKDVAVKQGNPMKDIRVEVKRGPSGQ